MCRKKCRSRRVRATINPRVEKPDVLATDRPPPRTSFMCLNSNEIISSTSKFDVFILNLRRVCGPFVPVGGTTICNIASGDGTVSCSILGVVKMYRNEFFLVIIEFCFACNFLYTYRELDLYWRVRDNIIFRSQIYSSP